MKRILTLLAIATFASCSIFAQDDMYFTPKSKAVKDKEKAEAKAAEEKRAAEEEARVLQAKKEWLRKNRQHISQTEDGQLVYHAGRDISDDEYNRRGKFASTYAIVSDSVGNDIIEFTAGDGKYPDSLVAYVLAAHGCYTTILGTHTGLTIHSSGTTLGTGTDHGFMILGTGMTHGTTVATTDGIHLIIEDIMTVTMADTMVGDTASTTTRL